MARRAALTALMLFLGNISAAPVDYTGFWKENCSDPYGLQIKPYNGQYMVTFCGPGGCGKPDAGAVTPIEGDKQYDALSPDKIRINYAENYAPIYTKCTTDTNPVLEYSAADLAEGRKGLAVTAALHVAYLFAAVLAYMFAHRRSAGLPSVRRRIVRSGLAALLFSPGLYLTWPFVNPTFALLAFVFSLAAISGDAGGLYYFLVQAIYSLGPVLLVWALLFAVGHIRGKLNPQDAPRHGAGDCGR